MKMQFKVTVKNGSKTVTEVLGREDAVSAASLTVGELVEDVHMAEQLLEKLTGYRWHVEQVG